MHKLGDLESLMPPLYGYAVALSGDPVLAEDLVQESMLRALAANRLPQESKPLKAWLFKTLRNAYIDHLRRQQRGESPLEEDDGEEKQADFDAWKAAEQSFDILTARLAYQALKPLQREIVGLIDVFGFSYAEAAELLNVPLGTVMSRISRARLEMVRHLAESNVTPLASQRRKRGG